jgi:hypothetical protein
MGRDEPTVDTSALPTLSPGRSLVIDATFAEAGDTILGLAFASAKPVVIPLRIPTAGTHRFTIEFTRN